MLWALQLRGFNNCVLQRKDLVTRSKDLRISRSSLTRMVLVETGHLLGMSNNHFGPVCQSDPVTYIFGLAPLVSISATKLSLLRMCIQDRTSDFAAISLTLRPANVFSIYESFLTISCTMRESRNG